MAIKPELPSDTLYEVATYLARPEVETEIHAEMPERHRQRFVDKYRELTDNQQLPAPAKEGPFYVWPIGTNKYGMELRIYFKDVPPTPPAIERLYTDQGKWYARRAAYRINHTNLVFQLFECGFLLGDNAGHEQRIECFMRRRFPAIADT